MSDTSTVQLPPVPPDTGGPPEPLTTPPGGHRRGWRVMLIAAVAALVLAIPLVLILALGRDPGRPGTGTGGPGPTNSVGVSPPGQPTASPTAAAPAPDGRIPISQLINATLDIPAWSSDNRACRSGPVTFRNGSEPDVANSPYPHNHNAMLPLADNRVPVYGDVDRDGAAETVIEIFCLSDIMEGGSAQVLALDRDRAGRIVTMGTVIATTGAVRSIDRLSLAVLDGGAVSVKVGDYQGCCGDETPVMWQVRRYGWTGQGFRQVGGPAEFPVNPNVTETAITAGELVFGPLVNGVRHGTLTVAVSYLRSARPDHLRISIERVPGVQPAGLWPPSSSDSWAYYLDVATPAVGGSRSYQLGFSRTATATAGDFDVHLTGIANQGGVLPEGNPYDNMARVTIRIGG